jgi:hypothetical protein
MSPLQPAKGLVLSLALATAICVALATGTMASAANLTWSSVDYATNPASENVLGQGLFQLASSGNVEVAVPGAISCPSASQCTAFGSGGATGEEKGAVATFDPSPLAEGSRAVIDTHNGNEFTGTCVSTVLCVAGDVEGYAFSFDPTNPGTPAAVPIDTATLEGGLTGGFACPSSEECVALDPDGHAFVFNPAALSVSGTKNISLGDTGSEYSYYAIACASATQCTAVGRLNIDLEWVEATFDPQASAEPEPHVVGVGSESGLTGVACPSLTQCTAVGSGNYEITFNPSTPGTPALTAFSPREEGPAGQGRAAITCASTEECFATVPGGGVDQSDPATGGAWTAEAVPAGEGMTWGVVGAGVNPVACASATLCVSVGAGATVGGLSTPPVVVPPPVAPPPVAPSKSTPPKITPPYLKGGFLKGLAKRRATLSFVVDAGKDTSDLSAITVTLPTGLAFVRSIKTLTRAISVGSADGRPLKFAVTIKHGKLTIELKSPQASGSETGVTILSKGLEVAMTLAGKVKRRVVGKTTVTIGAVDINHLTTTLPLKLKV